VNELAEQACLFDQAMSVGVHKELLSKMYAKPESCEVMSKLANHWNKVCWMALWSTIRLINIVFVCLFVFFCLTGWFN
jgi:hypothetical protein